MSTTNNSTNDSIRWVSSDSTAGTFTFEKSRAGGVITTADVLGNIKFSGHDGTGYIVGSQITSTSSGTIATNRVASDLKFYTHPDSVTASTLRMTISSTGAITVASPDSGTALTVTAGGLTVSSGNIAISSGDLTLPASTSTIGRILINSVLAMHTKGTRNLMLGNAGNYTMSGADNIFIGDGAGAARTSNGKSILIGTSCGRVMTDADITIGIGYQCLYNHNGSGGSHGDQNIAIGYQSMYSGTGPGKCTAIGTQTLYNASSTDMYCTAVGWSALSGITTGFGNTAYGYNSGSSLTGTDHSNVMIQHNGVAGDVHTIRIGTQGTGDFQQNKCFIAGIYNTAVGATAGVVLSDSSHQLGGLAGSSGQVLMGGTKPAFSTATYPLTTLQGDILSSTSDNTIVTLAKDTNATRYLSNTGTSNNAAWAQVNLTNGVTGILPPSNGGILPVTDSTTSNAVQMAVNNSYIATSTDGGTLVVYTLPATAAVGTLLQVIGKSTAFWEIDQNATQTIHQGATSTTTGVAGKITTAQQWSNVTLMCITANTDWEVIASTGTIALS